MMRPLYVCPLLYRVRWILMNLALLCAGGILAAPQLDAQTLKTIQGKVVDAKGAPVPAAGVRLFSKDPGPPLETVTDFDGTFSFVNLPGGVYRIEVEMRGFEKLSREGISADSESSRTLSLALQRPRPAAAARPPATAANQVQSGNGRERSNGGNPTFREVDLTGMQETDITQPTAAAGAADSVSASSPTSSIGDDSNVLVISGSSSASIDAGDFNNPEFRDRMREMAERMGFGGVGGGGPGGQPGGQGFGQFGPGGGGPPGMRGGGGPGGGSGGGPEGGGRFGGMGGRGRNMRQSRFNGSVYGNYRNSALNSRTYSLTGQEVSKPLQIQNNFGVSAGGSMPWGAKSGSGTAARQPGMWFFSYDGSRNRNPYDILTTVPTLLERAGDFTQTLMRQGPLAGQSIVIIDPVTNQPFAGAVIPSSRLNPAATGLMKYIPLPNLPGSVQNFTMQRGLVSTSDSFALRVNSRISAKHNIFANYSFRQGDSISSQIFPGLDTDRTNRGQNLGIGGMYRFKPRLIMNYRISFNRTRTLSSNPFSFTSDVADELGITGTSRDPINFGLPTIAFTNYGGLQLGNPSLNRTQTISMGGGLNRIGTKHGVLVGGNVNWNQRNSQVDPNARGTFDFTGFATSVFDSKGRPVAGTGYDFADFLLGLPYSTSRRFGSSNNYLRNADFSLFAQDNWRVRSNLTLNLGIRYEYTQPYFEKYNRIVGLDVAPGFTAVAPVFPGDVGPYGGRFPRSLVRGDKNNIGPRIGIAWKPKASSKWVFRAGYGLFYNPSVYPYIAGQLVGQPPFAVSQTLLTSLLDPLTLQKGFPLDPGVTIRNSYAIDPNYRIGYIQQWNLNVQTQFFKVYTVEVGYNGSKGTRLDILRAPNRAPAGVSPGATGANLAIDNAEYFVYQESGANSVLHSGRVRVNRRFSHGFQLESSYVLSKSLDNASGVGGATLVVAQDDQNLFAERSLSSFDQRHRFQNSFSLELPIGERRKYLSGVGPIWQKFIAGWNLNGNYRLNSGMPLTPRILGNVSNNSGTGSLSSERPDGTGERASLPRDQRTTSQFFNTAAFSIPLPGKFGDAARNSIPGPGTNLLNLSLRKTFRLDDNNRRLDLSWQVSNVLNHPNWAGVGTVVNALNFGRVTSAGAMRAMQFYLRISF